MKLSNFWATFGQFLCNFWATFWATSGLMHLSFQFRRLKFGDRFFYTHTNANGLSKVVKDEILQRTLGDVLCDVTRLGKVQTWVTLQPNSDYNPYKTCSSNRQLNVSQR